MDAELERQMRQVLAAERFGVLATLMGGRLHTATVHFAETEQLELVHAVRPATLKAQQADANPRVAFQVDNRGILMESRQRFTRISFEGSLRRVDQDDADYDEYRHTFATKLPVGERLLAQPEIALYVLRPSLIRLAIGASPAEDVSVTYELDQDDEPPDAEPAPPGLIAPDDSEVLRAPLGSGRAASDPALSEQPPIDDWNPVQRESPADDTAADDPDRPAPR